MYKYKFAMKNCYQIENKQTVQAHGVMVFKYTMDLIDVLKGKESKFNQSIPQIIIDNKEKILLKLLGFKSIKHYTMWHDIGKPFCERGS